MRTAFAVVAALVVAVVAFSVVLGLTAPDGSLQDDAVSAAATPSPAPPTATAAPATTPAAATASSDLAPRAVVGPWPGRPDAVEITGDTVDWCPAVTTTDSADAVRTFGEDRVEAAACAAVSFVLDQRYSSLALPRTTYRPSDFDGVLAALSDATATTYYRPRINDFIAHRDSAAATERLGVVLLTTAGPDHVFYGPKGTTRGYRDRAVWINPRWSTVAVGVDRTRATPRLVATFTASAAVPVFNTARRRDDMLTVPTTARLVLREQGEDWVIGGWDLTGGATSTARLTIR